MNPPPWDVGSDRRVDLSNRAIEQLVAVADELADAAAAPSLSHFRSPGLAVESKGVLDAAGWDPVTEADRATEDALRDVLGRRRPNDGIVGEERAPTSGTSGLTWVLDPIDGTRAYMAGLPTWCVLIALFDGVEPVIGVIDQPFTGERWTGIATPGLRRATWRRGEDERVLDCVGSASASLEEAVLHTTFPEVGTVEERAAFERVRDRVSLTRYGGDAYGYALAASGTVDLVVEAGLAPYDVQALIPVVRGAGGVISDWGGGPCHAGGRVVAAASPALHGAALELLA